MYIYFLHFYLSSKDPPFHPRTLEFCHKGLDLFYLLPVGEQQFEVLDKKIFSIIEKLIIARLVMVLCKEYMSWEYIVIYYWCWRCKKYVLLGNLQHSSVLSFRHHRLSFPLKLLVFLLRQSRFLLFFFSARPLLLSLQSSQLCLKANCLKLASF